MTTTAFRSDKLRDLYRAAIAQKWRNPTLRRNGHIYIQCPKRGCFYEAVFSLTSNALQHKLLNQIVTMRSHGLLWENRGGKHTAPVVRPRGKETSVNKGASTQ